MTDLSCGEGNEQCYREVTNVRKAARRAYFVNSAWSSMDGSPWQVLQVCTCVSNVFIALVMRITLPVWCQMFSLVRIACIAW
jgi:hypothetical protein